MEAGFSALKGSLLILSHGLTDCLCVAFPCCMHAFGKYLGHPTVGMTVRFVAAVASPRLIQVLEHMLAFWRTEAMQKINVEEALCGLVETRLCTRYSDATESLTSHKAEVRAELLPTPNHRRRKSVAGRVRPKVWSSGRSIRETVMACCSRTSAYVCALLLSVRGKVAVLELVALQRLMMSACVNVIENCDRVSRQSRHVHFIGRQTGGGADGVVFRELNVREVHIPVVLAFIRHHCQHLCHGVVDAFNNALTTGVVSGRRNFADAQPFEQGGGKLVAKTRSGQTVVYLLTRISAVPSAVYSASVSAYMQALRLNRSVTRKMYEYPRGVAQNSQY